MTQGKKLEGELSEGAEIYREGVERVRQMTKPWVTPAGAEVETIKINYLDGRVEQLTTIRVGWTLS